MYAKGNFLKEITDFSEEFFKEQTEENSDLKEYIDEKVKMISKKQKAENKTIWHCIFEELIGDIGTGGLEVVLGLEQSEGTTSELEEILSKFYSDSTFLQMDISQRYWKTMYIIMIEKSSRL